MKVPFTQADITIAEETAALEVLRSGWLTSGSQMKSLEQEIAVWLGPHVQAVACSSATAGLHLALEALGIGPGDDVLVPTWTFTATAEVVEYVKARPVLVDVDPQTMNVTAGLLEDARTPKTKAVIVVHFAGLPCDMNDIWAWAQRHGIRVIEDAAHALGSWHGLSPVGSSMLSDAIVFSFYATKCITTAEGGLVATSRLTLATRMRQMRLHGIDRDAFGRYTTDSTNWEYDVVAAGFKYNLADLNAAIGRVQFRRMEEMRLWRERIALFYDHELEKMNVALPPKGDRVSHHLYVVGVPNRNEVIEEMYARGVACSVHFKPLHRMTHWKKTAKGLFPGADMAYEGCLSLPIYSTMSIAQAGWVVESLASCLH